MICMHAHGGRNPLNFSPLTCVHARRCANAEAYVVQRLPAWVGDAGTAAKAATVIDYYLFDQGSVPGLAQSVTGVNISGVLTQINATRDQAVQARAKNPPLPFSPSSPPSRSFFPLSLLS